MLYACDAPWWKQYGVEAAHTCHADIERWTLSQRAMRDYGVQLAPSEQCDLTNLRHGTIRRGLNSGYQALELAALLWGCDAAVLLGFDFQRTGGKLHWHPDHPGGMGNLGDLPEWRAEMGVLAVHLTRMGVRVDNATRDTALTCFARTDLESALRHG